MGASVWEGGVEIKSSANAENTYLTELFLTTAGQTEFVLETFVYAPNSGSLDVYVQGVKQAPIGVYVETAVDKITFNFPFVKAGILVEVKGLVGGTAAQGALESANVATAQAVIATTAAYNASIEAASASESEAAAAASVSAASGFATAAQVSANLATFVAQGIIATSISSIDLTSESQVWQVQPNKLFQAGQFLTASYDLTHWLFLRVTSYDALTGVLNTTTVSNAGVGIYAAWNISLSGARGIQGPQGIQGIQGRTTLKTVSRNSNTIIGPNDTGTYFQLSGSFTQTFDTPANLTDTFYVYLENTSTGNITIPASDGRTNWVVYPEEIRLFLCDGATLVSKPLKTFNLTCTSLTNFVKPPGYSEFHGYIHGAGHGGAFVSGVNNSYGGGGGGRFPFTIAASLLTNSTVIQIGAGGAGKVVADGSEAGNVGGVTSFGSFLTMSSVGNARQGTAILNARQDGVTTVNSAFGFESLPFDSANGGLQKTIYAGTNASTSYSHTSIYGAAAGGSSILGGQGSTNPGVSTFAGAGGVAANTTGATAGNGTAPGGGGGAAAPAQGAIASGSGARGEVNIRGRI